MYIGDAVGAHVMEPEHRHTGLCSKDFIKHGKQPELAYLFDKVDLASVHATSGCAWFKQGYESAPLLACPKSGCLSASFWRILRSSSGPVECSGAEESQRIHRSLLEPAPRAGPLLSAFAR